MATREEVFATAAAVLVENGVLKEKGAIGKATAAITGSGKYEVRTDMIPEDIGGKLHDALKKLDDSPGAVLKNTKMLGLDRAMQAGGVIKDLQEGAAKNIGKVASGEGVAGHLEAKLNEAADAAKDKIKAMDPVTKIRGAVGVTDADLGKGTELAANTAQKRNSIRGNMIEQGAAQNGKGEVAEEPHQPHHGGVPNMKAGARNQSQGPSGASR